ncbi:MAG: hypothetical protein ABIO35_00845 [Nitrobacter sp.]
MTTSAAGVQFLQQLTALPFQELQIGSSTGMVELFVPFASKVRARGCRDV